MQLMPIMQIKYRLTFISLLLTISSLGIEVKAKEASFLDSCQFREVEKMQHLFGMIGPRLFYKSDRTQSPWDHTYGLSYSFNSLWTHWLEWQRVKVRCQKENQSQLASLFLSQGRDWVRKRPLQQQLKILEMATEKAEVLSGLLDRQLKSQIINLEKYYRLKKVFYRLHQERNRIEKELKLIKERPLLGQLQWDKFHEWDREEEALNQKIRLLDKLDLSVEWGKSVDKDHPRQSDHYVGLRLVLPLETLGSLFLYSSQMEDFGKWNQKRPSHPAIQLKGLLTELREELHMHKQNLKSLQELFPPEIWKSFERFGPERTQDLWWDHLLFYAESVYLKVLIQELEEIISHVSFQD